MKSATFFVAAAAALAIGAVALKPGAGSSITPLTPIPEVGEPGGPLRALGETDLARWVEGRSLFDRDFRPSEGLGSPEFNGDSCRACHEDPVIGGGGSLELNVSRFGHLENGVFTEMGDGQALSKLRRRDIPTGMTPRENIPAGANVFEQRQTISILGDGLIDLIPDSVILANEDPDDEDEDGISGVARRILIPGTLTEEVGRFGWKAQVPRLADFVRDAASGELGLTVPDNGRGFGLFTDTDPLPDPEVTDAVLDDITFFLANLAAPVRGNSEAPEVAQGEMLFTQIGCAKCHIPTLMSTEGPVPLYSDLLLHNVQDVAFGGMAEEGAGVGEYRTMPLWGCRDTQPYWHDGSAETLVDAILMHKGEAEAIRQTYENLTQLEKDAILAFIEDL